MPVSLHRMETLDVQSIPAMQDSSAIIVSVSGFVKFGFRPEKRFSQQFLLKRDPAHQQEMFYIVSDVFRLTQEE